MRRLDKLPNPGMANRRGRGRAPMRVLGYSGGVDGVPARFGQNHGAAAALVVDGRVIAACEEERFTREKRTGEFPSSAMEHCLRAGGLTSASEATLVCHDCWLSQRFQPEMLEANRSRLSQRSRNAL